ncbi:PREDICTED: odorant receptor Or1-like [Papilio polytes]|uniref:odorant receptor Or1-like n=1 Tax=Papilio polytes TaxID=76194 RepID=UPI000675F745|nr:PREDICTED: odorant receptor Or1-like [Papilio polytes]WCC57638.1 odorant receptor 48 [Papilio polytes]
MAVIVDNVNLSVCVSLTALRLVGFWAPEGLTVRGKWWYNVYGFFCFMFLLGTYIIIQVVDLFLIWGNLPLMTETAFLLFTNLAQVAKFINLAIREKMIKQIINEADQLLKREHTEEGKDIVKQCNRETAILQFVYMAITMVTMVGWASSAEKNKLPLRAWYPYDTHQSPAYELTYVHQVVALYVAANLNVGKDLLVTSLLAQCRCRLRLLALALTTLSQDINVVGNRLTKVQEKIVSARLRDCVLRHQAALNAAVQLQTCFSEPIFAQFTVSLVIICVTAFQLVSQVGNLVRLLSMGTYLLNMMYQVFIYCYQGNKLSEESVGVCGAAYAAPWHTYSTPLRRSLLVVMARSRRPARISAGGFTALSLASFMAIIKASYSLFTLLQQVEENK